MLYVCVCEKTNQEEAIQNMVNARVNVVDFWFRRAQKNKTKSTSSNKETMRLLMLLPIVIRCDTYTLKMEGYFSVYRFSNSKSLENSLKELTFSLKIERINEFQFKMISNGFYLIRHCLIRSKHANHDTWIVYSTLGTRKNKSNVWLICFETNKYELFPFEYHRQYSPAKLLVVFPSGEKIQ